MSSTTTGGRADEGAPGPALTCPGCGSPDVNLMCGLLCATCAETVDPGPARGTPWSLGVRCDEDCDTRYEGDFVVAVDSTRSERLAVVLCHAEKLGWRVIWRQPASDSETYCPSHALA